MEKAKRCKECCRNITEEAYKAYGGYCKSCYVEKEKYKYLKEQFNREQNSGEQNSSEEKGNKVATTVKLLSIINAIIGICIGINQINDYETGLGWTYIIGSIILAVFVYALGEIIQLLEDIKNK